MHKTLTALGKSRLAHTLQEILSYWPVAILLISYDLTHRSLLEGTVMIGFGLLVVIYLQRKSILQNRPLHIRALDVFISLCVVIELIAFAHSSFTFNSRGYLMIVLHAIATFYFVRYAFTTTQLRKCLFWTITVLGLYWALWTVHKAITTMAFISGQGFSDLSQFRNVYIPISRNNDWTLFLILMLPFALTLFLTSRKRVLTIIAGVTTTILAYCIVISFSRGGYIALALCFLIIAIGLLVFYRQALARFTIGLLLGAIAIGAGSIPHRPAVATTIMMNETASQQRSTESRLRMWEIARSTLHSHPLFGVGAYNFAFKYNVDHRRDLDEAPIARVTSVLTQLITEKGIAGVLIPLSALVYIAISVWRYLVTRKEDAIFTTCFVIAGIATIAGVCIRDLTMSVLLFKGFIFHIFCILVALMLSVTEVSWKSFVISRRTALLLLLPGIFLIGLCMWYEATNRYVSRQNRASVSALRSLSFGEAIEHSSQVLKFVPNHPIPHVNTAAALAQCGYVDTLTWDKLLLCKGNPDEAITHLRTAARIEPRDETILYAIGWLYAGQSNWPEAISHLNQAYQIDSTISVYPLSLGIVYEKQGDVWLACEYYARALMLEPDIALSRFYHEFVARNPQVGDTVLSMALLYFGDEHSDPISAARQGALHYFQNDYLTAVEFLTQAITVLPELNRPYFYLGEIALNSGDSSHTISLWDKSVTLDTNDQLVNWQFGMLLRESDIVRATSLLKRALKRGYTEPLQRKRRIFYGKLPSFGNTVLSVHFMQYINPEVDVAQIREQLKVLGN